MKVEVPTDIEHEGLKLLYNQVDRGEFGQWERWGLLNSLADYVLYYAKGDIVEIGCGESSIHLSRLAEKYNRKCFHCEYSKSGVENMKNTKGYFGKNSEVYCGRSDDFFKDVKLPVIALGFIDGDHTYEQATKDFRNLIRYVTNGYIFMHDTNPPDKSWTVPEKCGGVYKLREDLENTMYYDIFTFPYSAFGVGLTMVRNKLKTW